MLLEVAVIVKVCVSFAAPVPIPVKLIVCWVAFWQIAEGLAIADKAGVALLVILEPETITDVK